jgi:hypothetical protein
MLRSFSQIAEELGAIRIKIKYNYDHQREKNREVTIGPSRGGIGFKRTQRESEGNNLNFNFAYSNNNYINLNEYFLNDKILNENKFLLCKEDYESNIELKYLISARCKNLIEKYYTQFKHQTMNNVEMRIYTLLKEFDLEFQWNEFKREMIEITLQIDFLNILEDKKLIDGGNIYPLKEGYIYLKNILEREPILSSDPEPFAESPSLSPSSTPSPSIKFVKYINFLKAHLYCIQNGHIYLAYDYAYKKDVMKIYHQVIVMNFTEDEFIKYIESYWINQREWYHFIMLRDVLLKGNDNICDKFHFTTFQYMNIFHRKYHLLEMMEEQLKKTVPGLIHQQITEAIARFARNEYTYQDMIDYNSDDEKKMDQIKHQERIHPKKKKKVDGAAAPAKVPVEKLPEKLCEQIAHHRQKEMQQKANVTFVDIFANALNGYVWMDDDVGSSSQLPEERPEKSAIVCTLYKQYNDLCKGGNSMMQQFDSNLFKTHLEKSGFHSRVIELVTKGAKGTFYYAHGMSDNVDDVHRLEEIMMSVITYYYRDTIQVLQESCIQKLVHIEKYKMVDVMKLIQEVVQAISKWYIHKYKYVYNAGNQESKGNPIRNVMGSVTGMYDSLQKHADHDHSSPIQIPGTGQGTRRNSYESNSGSGAGGSGPVSAQSSPIQPIANPKQSPPLPPIDSEMEEEEEDGKRKIKKLSLIDECETIFVKFIIKHIHTNDDDKEPTYIKMEKRALIIEEKVRETVREEIPKEKSFINYRKHRLYFTYENLLKVIAKIKEAYPD